MHGQHMNLSLSAVQGAFQVELDSAAVAAPEFPLIYAAGAVAGPGGPAPAPGGRRRLQSEYDLQMHTQYGSTTLNLAEGTSSGVAGADAKKERMKNVGVLARALCAALRCITGWADHL